MNKKTNKHVHPEENSYKIDLIKNHFNMFTVNTVNQEEIECNKIQLNTLKNKIIDINIKQQAEIVNIRKRALEDINKIKKFTLETLITELLPVIDNLERAIEASIKIENKLIISLIQGVELTLKTFTNLFKKYGICVVDEINVQFNPSVHQAVAIIETDKILPDHVLMIMQKGYILNGKLIRPAMVSVSKKKE